MRIALVTGANGGFGKLITVELIKAGFLVIAAMRNTGSQDELVSMVKKLGMEAKLEIVEMDVTKEEQIENAAKWIESQYGQLDILINNAGYSQGGFIQDLTMEDWESQYDTNVLGAIRTTKMLIPLIKNSKQGRIVNISSVSGYFGFPGMGPYCSSKFAIEGFSESLRLELLSENIFVSLIEPGSFKTGIWEKGLEIGEGIQEDETLKRNTFNLAKQASETAGDPFIVANLVRRICDKKNPRFRYRVGKGTNSLWYIKKFIPWGIIEKIVIKKLNK
ncbi:SDR family NAD(P)-dependent oxidoreductase [Paucisalibacillus sp. EB02]|uniref:SDR family NAD(P)-dependent oxidoreductase n=1 Tax=Paucisalibacillus sp. EB02 TaxID=1347087 RepID=UPI0005A755A3|nr:SDR family NAD(P)-dependent oxidoreductase [Paucisalibacillus sp. EB02]